MYLRPDKRNNEERITLILIKILIVKIVRKYCKMLQVRGMAIDENFNRNS